jgi:hypothetical protein
MIVSDLVFFSYRFNLEMPSLCTIVKPQLFAKLQLLPQQRNAPRQPLNVQKPQHVRQQPPPNVQQPPPPLNVQLQLQQNAPLQRQNARQQQLP